MSTLEDQKHAVSDKETESPAAPIILFFIIGFAASLIIGWGIFPKLLYSQKRQPVDFNHALHVEEVGGECESCHYFREDGRFSGIPNLATCMECHEDVIGASAEEEKFVTEYVIPEREVPWLVYARQPDCVYFSHAPHVIAGKMTCVECHGHIGESVQSRIYEENRITGYSRDIWGRNIAGLAQNPWERMKMDDCSKCHVRENVNQGSVQTQKGGCFVCHK
ncbi:MAG: cytochrome c family protein [Deltaproteobacteria bacterium]|nr:cytochrome c family protein [Deltaproteobacteria bacterium]